MGTVVEAGKIVSTGEGVTVDPALDICQRNIRLLGMSHNPPRSFSAAMALLLRHRSIPFERLLTHVWSFDRIDEAMCDLTRSDAVNVSLAAA
ncbi:hypothetical protein ACWGLF_45130 [Streptomyces puniciscabiei]